MATTPNYGWVTPDNTSFVKDGAQSIRNVSNSIDATSAGANFAGLVLIKTQAFTAVTAVIVTSAFTATYDNYCVVLRYIQNTTTANLFYQNAAAGTQNATNYGGNGFNVAGNGASGVFAVTGAGGTGATQLTIGSAGSGIAFHTTATISSPAIASVTQMNFNTSVSSSLQLVAGTHNLATAFDGFRLNVDAGTFTGNVAVYGYRKAI